VVVVGAGFAGMYMLHRLRGLGFSARVYEQGGDGLGRTHDVGPRPAPGADRAGLVIGHLRAN
jgi:cation diffusion facilitator CzcD-associated flavoprotein CzcO